MSEARSYGGRTAEERAGERRGRLIEAAIRVLGESGETRATMTAICAEAGLTERYFYESFAHRDEALLAALDQVCEEIATETVRVVAETPGTPEQRIRAVMAAFVGLVVRDPARGRVAVVHSSSTPALRARRQELIGSFADLLATEAAVLYGDDAWPADTARLHGLVYIAGFAELLALWLTGGVQLTPGELVDTATELFTSLARRT